MTNPPLPGPPPEPPLPKEEQQEREESKPKPADNNERGKSLLLTRPQLAGTALLVMSSWLVIFLLPALPLSAPRAVHIVAYSIVGAVALACTLGLVMALVNTKLRLIALFGYIALLDILVTFGLTGVVRFTPELKFTLAVGGGALVAFLFGIVVFDTIRVAAALPVVVLFIGVVSYPVDIAAIDEVRTQLIAWMGVILGVTAIVEGTTQAAKVISGAQVSKAIANSAGTDTIAARELKASLTAPPQEAGGDLASTRNGNPTLADF